MPGEVSENIINLVLSTYTYKLTKFVLQKGGPRRSGVKLLVFQAGGPGLNPGVDNGNKKNKILPSWQS